MTRQPRLAIVVQRYGLEVNGGAEQHARWVAENMAESFDTHVITTCAIDYTTWADTYPPGESSLNQVHIHRFPVDAPRDWKTAQKDTGKLLNREHDDMDEVRWIKDQGPYSTPLLSWIQANRDEFDVFIFFTFHYATTYFGLPLVADKAILVPTAHDDPFLRLPSFRPIFHLPSGIAFNTTSEQEMVHRTFDNEYVPYRIIGLGIEIADDISADRFRATTGIGDDFILYVGRIDESKNVSELLSFFRRFRNERTLEGARPIKLVLIGRANMPLPVDPDIIALGFVPDEVKYDAIQAASVVVLPSLYESLSMITLESWAVGTPMLVNGRCDVVKRLTKESNGGLYYHSYEEFAAAFSALLASVPLRQQLGRQGQRFVHANYRPEVVLAKYRDLLENALGLPHLLDLRL